MEIIWCGYKRIGLSTDVGVNFVVVDVLRPDNTLLTHFTDLRSARTVRSLAMEGGASQQGSVSVCLCVYVCVRIEA